MAYTPPNAADLKARFPAFANVADTVVTAALGEAARLVDESWTEGDFATARMLYAAHVMTLEGQGSEGAAAIGLPFGAKKFRAGDTEIERFAGADQSKQSGYGSTSYGTRFAAIMRRNVGGPRSTSDYPNTAPLPYPWGLW